jgi:hypothetical protein
VRVVIIDARGSARTAGHLDALVRAALAKTAHPSTKRVAPESIVVAGHEEHAVARAQTAERRHLAREPLRAAVHEIARHRDQVGRERVHPLGEPRRECAAEQRADVDVGDLDDAEAVERARPACDLERLAPQPRRREPAAQTRRDGCRRDPEHDRGTPRGRRVADRRRRLGGARHSARGPQRGVAR